MIKSNCHLRAWQKFRYEIADSMSIQYTKNSKLYNFFSTRPIMVTLLAPIRSLGIIIQWLAWILVQIGEILRSGRWYHVTWKEGTVHKEFVPLEKSTKKWFPSIFFEGKEQEVPNETQ